MNDERIRRMIRELYADPTSALFDLVKAFGDGPPPEDTPPPSEELELPAAATPS